MAGAGKWARTSRHDAGEFGPSPPASAPSAALVVPGASAGIVGPRRTCGRHPDLPWFNQFGIPYVVLNRWLCVCDRVATEARRVRHIFARCARRSSVGSRHPGGCATPPQSVQPAYGTSSNTPLLEVRRETRRRRHLPPSTRAATEDPRRRGRSAPCAQPQARCLRPAARPPATIAPDSWLLKGGFALDLLADL
jgi:hypothetical protein